METIVYLLPTLGCVAMMGGMVWMMTRGGSKPDAGEHDQRQREIDSLRTEVSALRDGQLTNVTENDRG